MRIACVYLPQFPLQVHVRRAPHLAGRAVAVASNSDHPVVISCSRAARDAGIEPGMTISRARMRTADLVVRAATPSAYRQAIDAIADSLLGLSVTVDVGPELGDIGDDAAAHRAVYLHVPTGTRGDSFGSRILAQLSRQGFRARVGIADDRFSAWVAAASARGSRLSDDHGQRPFEHTCVSVPRGGSAAFLAPLSIGLLPLDIDVMSMLRSLGIVSLGDFAALPPPSIGCRWNDRGVDLRELARGDDPTPLRPFAPRNPVVEQVEIERPIRAVEPLTFMLRPLFDRVCDRLRGRGMAADQLVLRLISEHGSDAIAIDPDRPTVSGRTLVDRARIALGRRSLSSPVTAIEVAVLAEVELDADSAEADDRSGGQLLLSPLMRPRRDTHRRTMRGKRGKRNRRRRSIEQPRGLFE